MENIESGKIVLHRGREAKEVLAEETEELLRAAQTPDARAREHFVAEARTTAPSDVTSNPAPSGKTGSRRRRH